MNRHIFSRIIFFFVLFIAITDAVSAQQSSMFLSDISGRPINLKTEVNVNGNPYYPDNYTFSTLYLKGGGKIENVKSKIYLPDYSILYTTSDNKEMVAESVIEKVEYFFPLSGDNPIALSKIEFQLLPSSDKSGSIHKYYQVLVPGKVKLLKLYTSEMTEGKEFGSATVTKNYEKRTDLFVYNPLTGVNKISKVEKLLTSEFSDKTNLMTEFINKNKINPRHEKDLIPLFNYYNSL